MTLEETEKYPTLFRNEGQGTWRIVELDGSTLLVLPQGTEKTMTSVSPMTSFSRYSSVTRGEDGQVKTVLREGFEDPVSGPLAVTLLNQDGADVEKLVAPNGSSYFLSRSIPVKVLVGADSDWAKFQTVRLVKQPRAYKSPQWRGVLYWDEILKPVPSDPKSDVAVE
jgi:hypothetical protein